VVDSDEREDEGGSWFNWLPGAVVTSGGVLVAVMLLGTGALLGLLGVVFVILYSPVIGAVMIVLAAFFVWASLRVARKTLSPSGS